MFAACPTENLEFKGTNVKTEDALSWKECSQKCRGEVTCSFWSWVKPDSKRADAGKCYVNSDRGRQKLDGDVMSGYRSCGAPTSSVR